MEKTALMHMSESVYSFPISSNEVEIRLLTKKDDIIDKVELIFNDKYHFHERVFSQEIKKVYSDDLHDYYVTRIKLTDLRFAYVFRITTKEEVLYFSESGVTEDYDIKKGFYDFFQVPTINETDLVKRKEIMQNRVFYQIFVDRFNKSKGNKNPRSNIKWGDMVDQKSIAGGDLKGIREKLNYLIDLGIDALYLTPVFESDSNHKYNTKDYFSIAKDFGNDDDLKALIHECHDHKMIVVLDGVFNHIASSHEFFLDVKKNGNQSKYFNWFYIYGDNIDLTKNNYERFADDLNMPRLNLNNKEVQDYVISIGRYYIENFQIDGFRLDVSDEIPHKFWIRFKEEMLKLNKDFFLIGENWHNAHSFLNSGYEFDSIMNYAITKEVLGFVAWQKNSPLEFKNRIIADLMRYKTNVNYNMFNLLSSHDVHRFFTECEKDEDRFILGYSFIFTHIGVPCVYYGDEIGLEGNYDPDSRRCFIWDEKDWNKKIHCFLKAMIDIHKSYKINELDYHIEVENDIIVIERKNEKHCFRLYMNLSNEDKIIPVSDVILSNLYENQVLGNKGFVMTWKEKK